MERRRKTHQVDDFKNMRTCFEIVHSQVGREMWKEKATPTGGWKPGNKKHSVIANHPVVQQLRTGYGHTAKKCRKNTC